MVVDKLPQLRCDDRVWWSHDKYLKLRSVKYRKVAEVWRRREDGLDGEKVMLMRVANI